MSSSASIIIRTLNEWKGLRDLLDAINRQDFSGKKEIIVVDNESEDGTLKIAEAYGAKVITIKRNDFSFPYSLNAGAKTAQNDILFFTVGHALPFRNDWLKHGIEHFNDPKIAGVYAPVIPHKDCTFIETVFYWPGYLFAKLRGPHRIKKRMMGVLGATNCAIRRELWEKHHFDERFGMGGEDGEWAAWAMESKGFDLICDYRFSVRHSHGLNWKDFKKQIAYWSKLGKPLPFDRAELLGFRKDLKF